MAPRESLLPDLVRQDAAVMERPAIVALNEELSYRELWDRVLAVRGLLAAAGASPGDRIGLFFVRSADYVISLLATLMSGAIAVPLDADLPGQRVTQLVHTVQPKLVLHSVIPPPVGNRLDIRSEPLSVSRPLAVWGSQAGAGPLSPRPALVLFTSGSTGSPKGVVLHHAGVGNRLLWGHEYYGFEESDRVLHKASIGFDAALHEIFAPLIAGGCLVIAHLGLQFDSWGLVRFIQEFSISTAHFVPSVLRHVIEEPDLGGCTSLRRLFCGGEALEMPLVRRFQSILPARLFNQYGPTETSVSVTFWDCAEDYGGNIAPLGRPISNVQCHVLSSDLEPVPPGIPGELWISGMAVGCGYLDDEAQTRLRFRDDLSVGSGGRMYRTGDRVRLAPAGYLEFLGRIDDQVKIRGVRVEPEEVATVIRAHPQVRDAAVVGTKNSTGETDLLAYVQAERSHSPLIRGMQRVPLPNGLAVVSPSPDEARFLYRQIFDKNEYGRFGVAVPPGSVVVDIGANIGLFALWAAHVAPGLKVFAIEPNPDVLPYLSINLELYEIDAEIIPLAIADAVGQAELTAFRNLTYLSGLGERKEAAAALLRSHYKADTVVQLGMGQDDSDVLLRHAEKRLRPTTHTVETIDLATLLDRYSIDHIDLLKVNIEGSELAALRGLRQEQWQRIGQICLEVEHASRAVPQVRALLATRGFEVHEQADWNVGPEADVSYVYAVRSGAHLRRLPEWTRPIEPMLTIKELQKYLADRLPAAMKPSRITFLEELPRLSNGKVSKLDLLDLGGAASTPDEVALANGMRDSVREIWRTVLAVDEVADDDNFLLLGGHSLAALKISRRMRESVGLNIAPITFLKAATFADWFTDICRHTDTSGDAR